jgi:hypothetical protein
MPGLAIASSGDRHRTVYFKSMVNPVGSYKMWLATAWEEEYQHRVMFANQEDACKHAERWKDDLFDSVEVVQIGIMPDDEFPF